MMQSDVQTEGARSSALDIVLRAVAMLGFACAAAILVMLAFGVLGTWGVYLGFAAVCASPVGFVTLARQGTPVRVLPLLLPFVCMMVGALGILVSGWTLFLLVRTGVASG